MSGLSFADASGMQWRKYTGSFSSPEGLFSFELWAISHDHALLQLESLKETGKIDGLVVEEPSAMQAVEERIAELESALIYVLDLLGHTNIKLENGPRQKGFFWFEDYARQLLKNKGAPRAE